MKSFLSFFLTLISAFLWSQYISVNSETYTSEQLVKEIFFGPESLSCIEVSNVRINGWDFGSGQKSWGYFNKEGSGFELDAGIILSTGMATEAVGPNDFIQSRSVPGWMGDNDLESALGIDNSYNATILEFEFTVNNDYIKKISFDYLFASEQYLKDGTPKQCDYTDGFAFLIREVDSGMNYKNLAVIPGSNTPIKSNTVRGSGGLCPAVNEKYFGQYNDVQSAVNFNGQTKILKAVTDIIPHKKYHLKLVIADQGNGLYDSAVFLQAGSFMGIKDLGPDLLTSSQTALCEGSTLSLNAITAGATYQWYKDGVLLANETSATYDVMKPGFFEVEIDDGGCMLKGSILIEYAEKPLIKKNQSFCNESREKPASVNLSQMTAQIISNYQPYFEVKYYRNEADALAGNSNNITEFSYVTDTDIYVRAKSNQCAAVVEKIRLQTPEKSAVLQDQTICAEAKTTLAVENTFIYYQWMNSAGEIIAEGSHANIINDISVGNYSVKLTSQNGCTITQKVSVKAAELPIITKIEVTGSSAVITIQGGKPPYQITNSWNNEVLNGTNVFKNIPLGKHTIFVTDALSCTPVSKELLLLNLVNTITPNGDGKNDLLDYSELKSKKDVIFDIFDRYGTLVYRAQNQKFIWDGKANGRILPSATYWYILQWTEPDTGIVTQYKGWILLKNRD